MGENCLISGSLEPGCRLFDVPRFYNNRGKLFLYRTYGGKGALETHLRTGHVLSFNRESNDLVLGKTIFENELACEASCPEE
jgi:quinol monooxygenase YgiN